MSSGNQDHIKQDQELNEEQKDIIPSEILRAIEAKDKPLTWYARIMQLLVAPGACMAYIKKTPAWISAYLVCLALTIIAIPSTVVYLAIIREYFVEPIVWMPLADAAAYRLGHSQTPFPFLGFNLRIIGIPHLDALISGVLSNLILPAFSALGILIATKLFFKSEVRFIQYFAMFMHIRIITVLGEMVTAAAGVQLETRLNITSLAMVLMPNSDISMLPYNVFTSITIFGIWAAVVGAIGIKILNGFDYKKASVISGLWFISSVMYSALMWTMEFGYIRSLMG